MHRRRGARSTCAATLISIVLVACGGTDLPTASGVAVTSPAAESTDDGAGPSAAATADGTTDATAPASSTGLPVAGAEVRIDATAEGIAFDRRLLGTNLPAWLEAERFEDPDFQDEVLATGTTMIRLPGGSWSNAYDWHACEIGDEDGCFWPWAARPSDFAAFMEATGLPAMWTVSINHTAQHNAAAVAFFNGEVGDTTPIGVDRDGVDWGTVDTWASLRAEGGHPDPVRIDLWEVGNEVYGGKPDAGGAQCAPYGWEDVWTCDGTAYVTGDDAHDGYAAIRAAMLAVDPAIEVGAVGVPDPAGWNNWGNEVIEAAGGDLDFYVVHQYAFDASPAPDAALQRAPQLWPQVVDDVGAALGDAIPVAVTEYNLVAVDARDTDATMTQAMNALYTADTIGQLAAGGVDIANQWNVSSGTASSGTNYGLFSAEEDRRFPQFEALSMWSEAGSTLLPPLVASTVRIYPTRHDDGRLTIIVVNVGDTAMHSFTLSGAAPRAEASMTSAVALDPTSTEMTRTTELDLGPADEPFDVELPAYSITAIEVTDG